MAEQPTDPAHATDATNATRATDSELVRGAREGDTAAFEALTARHFPMVYALAYARLGAREAAEDLAQEVFLLAYLHLGVLADPSRFAAWLGRIARNEAGMWRRRSQSASRLVRLVPLDDLPAEPTAPASQEARTALEADEETRALREALFRLPEALREVVLLHYFEDLSKAEIAERLEVHPATVGRQIEKALKAMKRTLEPILRRAAPAFRHSGKAAARTTLLVGAVAALSAPAKAALLAEAGASAAALAALTQTAASWHTIFSGGFLMSAKTQFTAVLILLALLAGGAYYQISRTTAAPKEVLAATGGVRSGDPTTSTSATATFIADFAHFKEINDANRKQLRTAQVTLLQQTGDYPDPDEARRNAALQKLTEENDARLRTMLAQTRTPEEADGAKKRADQYLALQKKNLTETREREKREVYCFDFQNERCRVDSEPAGGGAAVQATVPAAAMPRSEMHSVTFYGLDGSIGTYYPLVKDMMLSKGPGRPSATSLLPCTGTVDPGEFERWVPAGCRSASVDGHEVVAYEFSSAQAGSESRMTLHVDPEIGYRYRRIEFREGDVLSRVRLASEYKVVNGVLIPFYCEDTSYYSGSGDPAVQRREVIRVQDAKINNPLADDAFECDGIDDRNFKRLGNRGSGGLGNGQVENPTIPAPVGIPVPLAP